MVEEERSMSKYTTTSGYKYDESISALQKMIRRGDEVEAMYWAIELEGKYHNDMWDRLEVISHEDIGDNFNEYNFVRKNLQRTIS
ncbi:MAG: hypothetical protein CM1200mP38_1600 [Dehalococcoidia bacterium]|nr:MAG: hypothetical protein CM1200mP38_1600 [Dehalococcoidia bacterium]